MPQRSDQLRHFVDWCAAHIKGDEKGEAQIFLDQFFRAFGHAGAKEAGATFEDRIKKEGKGTSFADLVWKPLVLVEMKKRGEDLTKHYRQAFDYWVRLVPGRPRWVLLCNFDEFWVYDFETQMDSPVDQVRLAELPERYGPLAFMFPEGDEPVFGNHQEQVTRAAADQLVALFRALIRRGIERGLAQRFTLQSLMALFAEDIGLLEKYFFARLLEDCATPTQAYDLIGQLFVEMNTPGVTAGGRFKGVSYFNGGLFAQPARIELMAGEIQLLRDAARFDWSKVRPEIFGAIFEHSMDAEARHAYGAHYTSPVDIMKIIGPTIVEPWRAQIEKAKSLGALKRLLVRIENFHVLDPACGSGNFLYIAYRELKRLEARIYERMGEYASVKSEQRPFGFVTARNFHGLDINPFAVELAKVTMMLAHKLAIDELHIEEAALPLDNLDANFMVGDALLREDGSRSPWPAADVIVGNPPFLGAKLLKPNFGTDYVKRLRKAYPEVPGMADFCVYWFRRAETHLPTCTAQDPLAGRGGLVGTQNIRNNASRVGGLDAICASGTVIEAVDNQPWSGEANVHVSIANWVKTQDDVLLPKQRRLWFKIEPAKGGARRPRGSGQASKDYELDMREVAHINASLSDKVDVGGAALLSCNEGVCYTGQYPRHKGFMLTAKQAQSMLKDSINNDVVKLFMVGEEMLTTGRTDRYVIDFQTRDILDAQRYLAPFEHLRQQVLPHVQTLAATEKLKSGKDTGQDQNWLKTWWQHFRCRPELIGKLSKLPRYLACSRVTKRPIFVFVDAAIRPGDALQVFALADDYSFGILQSVAHAQWFIANCSKLTERLRYTTETVFDTFPWPQAAAIEQVDAVAEAGRRLRALRDQSLQSMNGGLRALYRTLDLPGKNPLRDAHDALDAAVLKAYGFNPKCDLLEQLLHLNQQVAAEIAAGKAGVGPGIPAGYLNPSGLVSSDAYQPS
ncbi:DNA methyltransferase [Thiobacillus denitrificans]|uniref:site-specific DNA-methyltransferase (adenine-specific) n=1 Tax=Thiobacillus denitrificans TaxID=36861 RepID=A0A106BKN7_THIDE|nr:type IIL restriction-modification enzyme MmeI [Thiobacillus denitrificans]KVW94236.1 DNA methyltransferase [Thiobacillus denitrificans]